MPLSCCFVVNPSTCQLNGSMPTDMNRVLRIISVAAVLSVTYTTTSHAGVKAHQSPQPEPASSYVVKRGDNLAWIAAKVNVRLSDLLAANGLTAASTIHPGDILTVPAGTSPTGAPTDGEGSTVTYTVEAGDTLSDIAVEHGVAMSAVLEANGLVITSTIRPGDLLKVPSGKSGTALTAGTGQAKLETGADAPSSPTDSAVRLSAFPVQGLCDYEDSWMDPRPGGRRHQGADIIAAEGKYVYAVVDGTITDKLWDVPGRISGNSLRLTADDGSKTYFFYAHLLDFVPGLREGDRVKAGQIVGFVGSTGLSSTAHLHFEVHPGGGEATNPLALLGAVDGCSDTTPGPTAFG
jgi:murein DD-endopeptidase MepM/ murein hydrolase activator NlpD